MPLFPKDIESTLFQGDCLEVMSRFPAACIDLIYIDPPFGTGKARKGDRLPLAPGGRIRGEEKADDTFRFEDTWAGDLKGYLGWLRPRLQCMARLVKPAGSMLVHVDWNASHYIKVMLDEVMGRRNFVNEIIWHYKTGGHSRKRLSRKFDSIFWYAKGERFTYNPEAAALPRNRCRLCGDELKRRNHMKRRTDEKGRTVSLIRSGGRIYEYYEDAPAAPCDVWLDIGHLHQRDPERTGYPTQKPLKLLERLVSLCSRPGDVVADFFAGTGTTLIAAARLKRKWVGAEKEAEALRLAFDRFRALSLPHRLVKEKEIARGE